ncbi:MAG: rod shape-determining protein RodA [Firmicutes bacterium]|nr:rod shape-determining protein RodA [Bacillota bacterium]
MNFEWRLLRYLDWVLLLTVLLLTGVGLVMVASAARGYQPGNWQIYVYKQLAGMVLGLLAMAVTLLFDYTEFGRMHRFLYVVNLILLLLVWVPGLGVEHNNARSWLNLGIVELQPAELTKILVILTLGWQLARAESLREWWDLVPHVAHVLPFLALILMQPDLGSALVLLALAAGMLYMAGVPGWRFLVAGGLAAALVAGVLVAYEHGIDLPGISEYQVNRIRCWLNPEFDTREACYNVIQSRVAIAVGGLQGAGLFSGTQTQLGFVPEQPTDFIFSAVGEELGFLGASGVLLLFLILMWRILLTAIQAKDRYGTLIATGVAAMLGFHVLENTGMAVGLMPVTGIPLPFISYGPTALVANYIAIGLVLNVGMRRQPILF